MIRHLARALDLALLGALVLFTALGFALSVSGCSTFLPTADRVSLVANRAIAIAQREAHDQRAHQLDQCADETCLDAGEQAWAPWIATLEFVRAAAADFDDVLGSAGRLGDSPQVEEIVLEAACDLLHAFDRLPPGIAALAPLGIHVAEVDIPPVLLEFLRLAHTAGAVLCPTPDPGVGGAQ